MDDELRDFLRNGVIVHVKRHNYNLDEIKAVVTESVINSVYEIIEEKDARIKELEDERTA